MAFLLEAFVSVCRLDTCPRLFILRECCWRGLIFARVLTETSIRKVVTLLLAVTCLERGKFAASIKFTLQSSVLPQEETMSQEPEKVVF